MKPSHRLFLAFVAVSALLLNPSARGCGDETSSASKSEAKDPAEPGAKVTAKGDPKSPEPAKAAPPAARTLALPRMIVTRDRETGRIRAATAEEIRTLSAAPKATSIRSTESLPVVTLPDGSKVVDLTDRYFSMAVAKKGPDGKVRERCVESDREKSEFLSGAALAAPAPPAAVADEK
jgi:hypothetical protein